MKTVTSSWTGSLELAESCTTPLYCWAPVLKGCRLGGLVVDLEHYQVK